MSRRRRSFWNRSRDWPLVAQLGFALVVILIAVVVAGALHGRGASTSSASSPPTTTAGSARPTAVSVSPLPTGLVPKKNAPVVGTSPSTPVGGSRALLPLAIAAPSHTDTYDRAADFGGFVDVDGCEDTRAEVLIRTSAVPVTFTNPDDCTVKTGRWTDPWSGVTTTVAHDFQIDHTVPLANAWASGAWSWTHAQRVAYANDLTDTDHLVPILTHENESKIDKGPDGWKPPSESAWCLYAQVWDHIKAKWKLSATPAEWTALVAMAATC